MSRFVASSRWPFPLALSLLMAGCQPAALLPGLTSPTDRPAQRVNPTELSTGQSAPLPPASKAPLTELTARIVFPPGSYLKLRSRMRTLAAVNPEDISLADLASLNWQINGQPLTRDQVNLGKLEWDAQGQLIANLTLVNLPPTTTATLQVSNGSGSVALQATVDATAGAQVQVDVRSTARSLIVQAMTAKGKTTTPEEVDERAVTLVANQLSNLIVSGAQTSVLSHPAFVNLVTTTSSTLLTGPTATLTEQLRQVELAAAPGGGGSSTAAAPPAPVTPPSTPTVPALQSVTTPFGMASIYDMTAVGSTLYAVGNGLSLIKSTDDGVTWTKNSPTIDGNHFAVSGTTLYTAYQSLAANGTKTTLDRTGLPNFSESGIAVLANHLYLAQGDGKVYAKDLGASGPWIQYGIPGWQVSSQITALVADGGNLYVSTSEGVFKLAGGSAGGTWTLLSNGTAPTGWGSLFQQGGNVYATNNGGNSKNVYAWDGTTWTTELVNASFHPKNFWADATDLYVGGLYDHAFTLDGVTQTYPKDVAIFSRPLAGGAWSQVGPTISGSSVEPDKVRGMTTAAGTVLAASCRKASGSTAWTMPMSQFADYQDRAGMVAAGGYVWLCTADQVWRYDPTGNLWQQLDSGLPAGWRIRITNRPTNFQAFGTTLYLALGRSVYTLDATATSPTWQDFGTKPGAAGYIGGLACDGTSILALQTDNSSASQAYKAPISGGAWAAFGPSRADLSFGSPEAVAVGGTTLYIAANSGHVRFCQDGDPTWQEQAGVNAKGLVATAARLIAVNSSGAVQWDGNTWSPMTGLTGYTTSIIATADGYYSTSSGNPTGIFHLPLGGTTWSLFANTGSSLSNLCYEPVSQKFYGTGIGKGVVRTP